MNYIYAQLDINNICVGVSELSGEVPELNYSTESTYNPITGETVQGGEVFVSRMIRIPVMSNSFVGLKYNNGNWQEV